MFLRAKSELTITSLAKMNAESEIALASFKLKFRLMF